MKGALRAIVAAVFAVVGISSAAVALQGAPESAAKPDAKAEVIVPFIGNATCPMQAGKKVNATKYVEFEHARVYLCCGKCLAAAKSDPKSLVAKTYAESKAVGNKKCPVSGHAIDAASAKSVTFMGHSIDLCCGDCEAAFKKDPYVMTVAAIYGAEDLKNGKCPVMDEEAGTEDMVIYKGKIVRLCCGDCCEEFKKDPEKFLAKASAK